MSEAKQIKIQHTKESFREKMTDLFEEMWEKIGRHHHGVSGSAAGEVAADTDLSETDNALTYSLELPGMDENDVEISIDAGRLSIRGEKRDEREEKGENYVFRERRFGSFERSFTLPGNADEQKVQATLSKGVLTVTIPCEGEPGGGSRKIKITSG